jgi:hypothetical protein
MPLSRLEIKKRMVELARKYVESHPKIIKELKLGRELEKLNEQSDCYSPKAGARLP